MLVRPAKADDIDHVVELLREAHERSTVYRSVPYNEKRVREQLESWRIDPQTYFGVTDDGVIVGSVHKAWQFDGMIATGHIVYARKHGLDLLRAFLRWSRGWSAVRRINLAESFGELGHDKIYERLGLQKVGGSYAEVR
jgi:hypothetical protein